MKIIVKFIHEHKYKWIGQSFKADWANLKTYPRFWLNKAIKVPNFNHWSLTIRFGWWYFGIQKKFNTEITED